MFPLFFVGIRGIGGRGICWRRDWRMERKYLLSVIDQKGRIWLPNWDVVHVTRLISFCCILFHSFYVPKKKLISFFLWSTGRINWSNCLCYQISMYHSFIHSSNLFLSIFLITSSLNSTVDSTTNFNRFFFWNAQILIKLFNAYLTI